MLLKRTDIAEKLSRLRRRDASESEILQEVYRILNPENPELLRIENQLQHSETGRSNDFDFDQLESHRIFHIEQIRKICIDYRLRFLESRYFKGVIPVEAMEEIQRLEADHNTAIKGFKIIAPSRLFRLEDKDDPLLFAPIGNGYYYLIHKWGNDLHPLRKLFAWPFKSIGNLTALVLLISYLTTLLVPDGLFTRNGGATEFWITFFFMFKSIAAVVIFYGFALGKNFNPAIWNSKYFNA